MADERPSVYQARVELLLGLIEKAVLEGHLPQFEAFILEGAIPDMFFHTVKRLEAHLLKWQFMQKLAEAKLVA